MTSKREWIDISRLNPGNPPDEQHIVPLLQKITQGHRRAVRCFRRADGQYDVADSIDAAWTEAYRRAGMQQVPIFIQPGREPNQVQKALTALHAAPIDPGLSQQALAQQLGVSRGALRRALQLQPLTTCSAQLHLWEKPLVDHAIPLQPGSIDLIATYAPNLTPNPYAPLFARWLSPTGRIWLVFEAAQQDLLRDWYTALSSAELDFQRLAVWTIPSRRSLPGVRLAGYRLMLAFGKPASGHTDEDPATIYPGWVGPRAPAEVDPSQRIIPAWLWRRWLTELPSTQTALDAFATSTTIFDAARSLPQLRIAWACPVEASARVLLRDYLDKLS